MRFRLLAGVAAALVAACLTITVASGARAQEKQDKNNDDPSFLSLTVGYHDAFDERNTVEGRLEYRDGRKFWIFKPVIGVLATGDEAVMGYAGVLVDMYFGNRWVLTPSFTPGLYRGGNGIDLGGTLEFKSQLELSYRFDNRSRLGIGISHISNADIYDSNPGTETVFMTYSLPLGSR